MATFTSRLKEHAQATEAFLDDLLSGISGTPDRLGAAMRLAVMGGGKRFRPFLVIETAALFGVTNDRAIATAGALECLHCYSLVHDDLPAMDNDRMRRGQPTVWAAYDDWTAVLAGDALLTLAFEMLTRPSTHADPATRNALVAALAMAAGPAGMVGGQILDLSSDKLGEPPDPTLAYIRQLQALKTGALIRFACEAGGLLGGADDPEMRALSSYGAHLGVVFQIADDLLDATGNSITVGKATGKDEAAGKATQVSLLGVDAARDYLNTTADAALADIAPFGARGDILSEAVSFAANRTS
jgi:farnesyl diphosphate synthase